LVRLFRLGQPTPAAAVEAAFAPLSLDELVAIGLIALDDGRISSPFNLHEIEGLYLFSDRPQTERNDLPPDYVTGVNGTSLALAAMTIRKAIPSALDLGTGCGVQALLAARHAERVIATDFNQRALCFTSFNARVNGLANVECRHGSWMEPVDGETFDLVVSNPPFVISPESRYLFRDSGQVADGICEQLVRALPAFLKEGGFGHVFCNWVCEPAGSWADAPKRWRGESDCNVLTLLFMTEDPLTYAARWLSPSDPAQAAGYSASLDAWLDYFRRNDIKAISTGGLIFQRQTGPFRWFHPYEVGERVFAPSGDQLTRLFTANDLMSKLFGDSSPLLRCSLRPAEDFIVDQLYCRGGRLPIPSTAEIRFRQGLPFRSTINRTGLRLLERCDGRRTLAELVRQLASERKTPVDELALEARDTFRDLLLLGFVVVED
jgi:hypothetical protein